VKGAGHLVVAPQADASPVSQNDMSGENGAGGFHLFFANHGFPGLGQQGRCEVGRIVPYSPVKGEGFRSAHDHFPRSPDQSRMGGGIVFPGREHFAVHGKLAGGQVSTQFQQGAGDNRQFSLGMERSVVVDDQGGPAGYLNGTFAEGTGRGGFQDSRLNVGIS